MGWAALQPTQEELDLWMFTAQQGFPKISRWPKPNSARVDSFFRIKYVEPALIPIAGRYGFLYREDGLDWDLDAPSTNFFGGFDAFAVGEDHIRLLMGENAHGFDVTVDIEAVESTPDALVQGVVITITMVHATFGTQTAVGEYPVTEISDRWNWVSNTDFHAPKFGWQYTNDPSWTIPVLEPILWGVPDCFVFPRLPVGMAAFNGSDAYIALDHNITGLNQDFVIECDVRLNDSSTWWPVFGQAGLGGFIGMDGADLIFGGLRQATSWTPVEDVWFNWRLEFEQPDQLKVKLFIDDTLVATRVTNRFNAPINRVGVYKQGVGGSLWMDGDMKNLKVLLGDYPSTDVELDMPLIENALDVGPGENHGTTFNMRLPSV